MPLPPRSRSHRPASAPRSRSAARPERGALARSVIGAGEPRTALAKHNTASSVPAPDPARPITICVRCSGFQVRGRLKRVGMDSARRPVASAMSAMMGALRGKFSNRQGHSKGAFPLTSKRGPRDFYKGKGAKSTGRLTKKGEDAGRVEMACFSRRRAGLGAVGRRESAVHHSREGGREVGERASMSASVALRLCISLFLSPSRCLAACVYLCTCACVSVALSVGLSLLPIRTLL